jgi:hypothetical protein
VTKPLASGLVKLSAPALKKGLRTEVGNVPKHTGVDKTILAKDFSALFRDAEEILREEQVLELQSHSSRASDA